MKKTIKLGKASVVKRPAGAAVSKRRVTKVVQRKLAHGNNFDEPIDPVMFFASSSSAEVKVGAGRLREIDVWRSKKVKHRYGQDCHTNLLGFEQAVRRVFSSLEDSYKDKKYDNFDVFHGYKRKDIKNAISVTAQYGPASQVLLLCRFLFGMFEMMNMPDYGDYHNTKNDAPEDWILNDVCKSMQKPLRAASESDFSHAASKELLIDAVGVFTFSAGCHRYECAWAMPYCQQLLRTVPVAIPSGWHPHAPVLLSSALQMGELPRNCTRWR